MDQRSQERSVAGRSALVDRMLAVFERQHEERVAGDKQHLNEQHAISDMMQMVRDRVCDEESPEGATSKAAPPKQPALQPPQPQCPNGHGLGDFRTTTNQYFCDGCRNGLPEAYVTKSCRACNYDLCQICADAMAANGRQQSAQGQRRGRRRTGRRSHDKDRHRGQESCQPTS